MATVIVDFTAFPQAVTVNGTQLTALNDGKWRATFTFTQASSNAAWGGGGYFALTACNDNGGLWIYDNGGTRMLALFENASGSPLIIEQALTWGAGASVTVVVDNVADTLTISGATTGNGTFSFTGSTTADAFGTSPLGGGAYGGGGYTWAGSMTDIDDGNDAVTRSASASNTVDAVLAGTRAIARAVAASAAVAATLAATAQINRSASASNTVEAVLSATSTGGGTTRSASASNTVEATLAATRAVARAASATSTPEAVIAATRAIARSASATNAVEATLAATTATTFGPGVRSSAVDEFGHGTATMTIPGGYLPSGTTDIDGRTPTAVDTQPSGSAIYYAVGRPSAVASSAITDNKGNTYTELNAGTYGLGAGASWKTSSGVCIGATGGSNHVLSSPGVVSNEQTLGWDEIKEAHYLADSAQAHTPSGSTQQSPAVDLEDAGWVYVDWFGDGNTFGAEGFLWTVTATGEGTNVGDWQVCDARITNHTNGWIQWKRWRKYFAAATSNIQLQLSSLNPTQGTDWHVAAFQESHTVSRTVAASNAVDATLAATRAVARSASASNAVAATLAASRTATGAAASSSTVDATLAATRAVARTAAATSAPDATLAATSQIARSVAASNATDATLAATRVIQRAGSASAAVDAQLAATRQVERAASASSTVEATLAATASAADTRSASAESTVDATLSATRAVARGASADSAVDAVLAATRAVERGASASNTVGATLAATVSGTITSLPRTFTVTVGVPAADDFTVEVTQ